MNNVGPKTKAMLHLPKFKLEHQFSAKDILIALGMTEVFSDGAADLSGISGKKDLHVSQVYRCIFRLECALMWIWCRLDLSKYATACEVENESYRMKL